MANKQATNETSLSVMIDITSLLLFYYLMNSMRTIFIVILKLLQKSAIFV